MNIYPNIIINLVQSILLGVTGLPVLYLFSFALAGLFYKKPKAISPAGTLRKIAVLIPGYKEDSVIVDVARQALMQDYPRDLYEVVVIADSFHPDTVAELKVLPIRVIEVVFNKSTKVRSLRRAMQKLNNSFELVVILDADNVMERDFLRKINKGFDEGYLVVQGHRKAANMDTSLAVLDAASEEINNHIFRKGHRALGFSSAIIGSGMAVQADYFRKLINAATAVGGFDKEMELNILKQGHKIQYIHDAVVYDEKVRRDDVFTNQRRRWLSAQLFYLRLDLPEGFRKLFSDGNIDYFEKILQFMLPPRILLLGGILLMSFVFIPLNIKTNQYGFLISWSSLMALCLSVFIFSLPSYFYSMRTLRALASLPRGFWLMLVSLMKIKGANQNFIHTAHGTAVKTKT
jgi:cellulose synthase/poly-beta-1,6-N-acetylglucosamine synthase-like glycosyltransferase